MFGLSKPDAQQQEEDHLRIVLDGVERSKTARDTLVVVRGHEVLVHGTTQHKLRKEPDFAEAYRQFDMAVRTHMLGETLPNPETQAHSRPEQG